MFKGQKTYVHRLDFESNFHYGWTRNIDRNRDLILIARMLMIPWWTRTFNEIADLIPTAMNAYEILKLWWTKFLTRMWIWSLQQKMLMKFSTMMDPIFWQAFGFDIYSSECLWNYRTRSFTITCYDLAKEDQLDAKMMILTFRTFNAPERLFVNL